MLVLMDGGEGGTLLRILLFLPQPKKVPGSLPGWRCLCHLLLDLKCWCVRSKLLLYFHINFSWCQGEGVLVSSQYSWYLLIFADLLSQRWAQRKGHCWLPLVGSTDTSVQMELTRHLSRYSSRSNDQFYSFLCFKVYVLLEKQQTNFMMGYDVLLLSTSANENNLKDLFVLFTGYIFTKQSWMINRCFQIHLCSPDTSMHSFRERLASFC